MINIFFIKLFFVFSYGDVAEKWQLGPQDPASNLMEGIINFHNFLFCIIIAIGVSVGLVLFETLYKFNDKKNPIPAKFAHASLLEII
jgi:cytochrome c oxidase subunit 2